MTVDRRPVFVPWDYEGMKVSDSADLEVFIDSITHFIRASGFFGEVEIHPVIGLGEDDRMTKYIYDWLKILGITTVVVGSGARNAADKRIRKHIKSWRKAHRKNHTQGVLVLMASDGGYISQMEHLQSLHIPTMLIYQDATINPDLLDLPYVNRVSLQAMQVNYSNFILGLPYVPGYAFGVDPPFPGPPGGGYRPPGGGYRPPGGGYRPPGGGYRPPGGGYRPPGGYRPHYGHPGFGASTDSGALEEETGESYLWDCLVCACDPPGQGFENFSRREEQQEPVLVTAAVVGLIAHYVACQAAPAAIVIGNGLALSSTAVVPQVLQERSESTSSHGRASFSVLLFQVAKSIDPKLLLSNFPVIVGTLGLLTVGKTMLVVINGKLFGISIISAIRVGVLLAPGGEFAFVAFGEAVNQGIMSPRLSSLLFLVVGISMAITPWLAAGGQLIASRFELHDVRSLLPVESETDDLQDHVIICGFGRVGQVLHKIGAETACAAVVALDAPGANYRCVWALSKYYPNVKTSVCAHDVVHGLNLEKAGATAVVPETLEPSLQLAAAVLAQAKLPTSEIANTINEFRTRHLSELTELSEASGSSLGYGFSRPSKPKPQPTDASDDNQITEGGILAI